MSRQTRRLADDIELLRVTDEVAEFATALVASGGVPEAAGADVVHFALAAVNGISLGSKTAAADTRMRLVRQCRYDGCLAL